MNVIECNDLIKLQGRKKALNGMTFAIKAHTITGLIGRNGAGKTNLLRILAGYWRPDSGSLKVFGREPFESLEVSANSILIDDEMQFPATMNLSEILDEGARFYENWDGQLANGLMSYFEISGKQHHIQLSKGKRSTFNTILGLAARCPLTLFDEPATGMDANVRSDFYRALLKEYLAFPRTIIVSSHHMEEMEHLFEDVLLVDQGKAKLHIGLEDLKEYAISAEGDKQTIGRFTENAEVLFEKKEALGSVKQVIRNTLSAETLSAMKNAGIRLSAVSPADACMYVTNRHKGGIDDVFENRAAESGR